MKLIPAETTPSVWFAAADYLAERPHGEDFDVILHVDKPTVLSVADREVYLEVDRFLVSHGAFGIHTVAETIFPLDEYLRCGADGVFREYPEKILAIQKARDDGNWGCYAYRFLRQKDADGTIYNPLEQLIIKIKEHGQYRASFELGPGQHPFESAIPIYEPAVDRKRLYGGPCLSHLSIKVHEGKIRFNATYRSHYYMRRLLGNLVGLGRLQYFVARETGLEVGELTINSTFARLDTATGSECNGHWTKKDIKELLARCREIYAGSAAVGA